MGLFALTTFGPDRPGTLARISKLLDERGCNIEDVSATILRGHGATMMILRAPESDTAATLEAAARGVVADTDVAVNVQPCVAAAAGPAPTPTHVLSVYGADRTGIVHRLTTLLAERSINLTDFDSRVVGRADRPIYAMLVEMELPAGHDVEALKDELKTLGKDLDVDVSLREVD